MPFYVYRLLCSDRSYYTGQTDDMESRLAAHELGTDGAYAKGRRPVRLVFAEEFATREEARERERQIKGWSRRKKEALIRGDWDALVAHATARRTVVRPPSTSSGWTDHSEGDGVTMTTETTNDVLLETNLDLPKFQGKVRDVYDLGDRLLIVATDRVSAFDVVLPNGIPDKGRVLTQMSAFWFEQTADVVPNHMIRVIDSTQNPDLPVSLGPEFIGRTMLVRKTVPVKLEAIVRGYLSGTGWKDYQATGKVCGIPLPAGLRESDALPQAIFTPSTKADEGHDENISYEQAVEIVGAEVANTVKVRSMSLYMYGLERAHQRGFVIADTKFEFGIVRNADGEDEAILIDEALTPDSSRFWEIAIYKPGQPQPSFDKQPLRDWLESTGWNKEPPAPAMPPEVLALLRERYVQGFERITGRELLRPSAVSEGA